MTQLLCKYHVCLLSLSQSQSDDRQKRPSFRNFKVSNTSSRISSNEFWSQPMYNDWFQIALTNDSAP